MRNLIERLEEKSMLGEAVADTILKQIGGASRLKMMIGARNFVSDNGGKTLQFQWPKKGKGTPGVIKISLNGRDTYDVEFGRIAKKKSDFPGVMSSYYKKMKSYKNIYADQLMDIFERETGLFLTFGRRG